MSTLTYQTTRILLNGLTRMIEADIRVHNADAVKSDMSILYVSNHFTRMETLLLPYELEKHTGRQCRALASRELFAGWLGEFITSLGAISTDNPERDAIILRDLLVGEHPWVIFPEGGMIKDKKTVNEEGDFEIYAGKGLRRKPYTGAGVLALLAEYRRQELIDLNNRGDRAAVEAAMTKLGFDSFDQLNLILRRHTVIVPVNITYYPIRAQENFATSWARFFSGKEPLSMRALEELSVEGTILAGDSNVDIRLGEPIEIGSYLRGIDLPEAEDDSAPEPDVRQAAESLMLRYMADIYRMTTLNPDHILATIIRYQGAAQFTERAYRNRVFLATHKILELGTQKVHTILEKYYREILYEEESLRLTNFLELCQNEGIIVRRGNVYRRNPARRKADGEFQTIRLKSLADVIANEIEPLSAVTNIIREIATMPRPALSQLVRETILAEDQELYEKDYEASFEEGVSKDREVGRPFLLLPTAKAHAGIVLIHGYLAAPAELRGMAEHFRDKGYAVYVVRLRGHGTTPKNLSQTRWEEWYESVNRGYSVIKSLTDQIIIGGFSTGGVLAMLAAGRKGDKACAVFSINAPLHLRNYASHVIPSINTLNALLGRIRLRRAGWDFIPNDTESPEVNYLMNPVSGVNELNDCILKMEESLPKIQIPALVLQASKDTTVDPISGQLIFSHIGSPEKELTYFERDRHIIIRGEGSEDIFERIAQFMQRAERKRRSRQQRAAQAEAEKGHAEETAEAAGETVADESSEVSLAEPVEAAAASAEPEVAEEA